MKEFSEQITLPSKKLLLPDKIVTKYPFFSIFNAEICFWQLLH